MALFTKPHTVAKVVALPVEEIDPSPWQARTVFDEAALEALADSIRQRGLLQPISVRRWEGRYQLIAGERRLRAAKLAGLVNIPSIILDCSDMNSALLGLEENLKRADLNCFEQAGGLRDLIALWGCSQAEAAARLNLSQPALANKLRLLQLTADQQQLIVQHHLTERHARALLRLPEEKREGVLLYIIERELNVSQTEGYIESLLTEKPNPKRLVLIRDVRLFLNTINKAVKTMVSCGVPATAQRIDTETHIEYTVRIPISAASKSAHP